ncbi:MAG: hypothetical protein IIA62_07380 [Nitrospinae bacterium]|nr:hypothetical protein [Nitrospinota bacterium]
MDFEHRLKALALFHLEEGFSGRHLLRKTIGPIKKSAFFEAINHRGLGQMTHDFQGLKAQASDLLPKGRPAPGDLAAIDGSLIDAVLSIHYWAWSNSGKIFDLKRCFAQLG